MSPARALRYAVAGAGAGLLGCGGYVAVAWARYGRADPRRHPRDELLDRFLPEPEVDEYHRLKVRAPAAVTFAAAKQMDIQASPVVKGVFWLRAVPFLLQGQPFRPQGSRSIVAETLDQGWGVLAEVPDREIVVGAYAQPWHEHVTFHPLPPRSSRRSASPLREDRVDNGRHARTSRTGQRRRASCSCLPVRPDPAQHRACTGGGASNARAFWEHAGGSKILSSGFRRK